MSAADDPSRPPAPPGDYLWDGTGPVDDDVAQLEAALGGLRHAGAPPAPRAAAPRPRRRAIAIALVTAGAVAAAAALLLWLGLRATAPCGGSRGYRFATVAGVARCGDRAVARGTLPVGGWLETSADGAAELEVAGLGQVRVGPASRVRLDASNEAHQRLTLARGALHATITAPPRIFVVDTPSATAIDLGCEYDLAVDPDGDGTLAVTRGQVELAGGGHLAIVPAGASARTRPKLGPGTPVRRSAAPALADAVARFDGGDRAALDDILDRAELADAITLFNLFDRTDAAERGRVYDRLVVIAPPPPGVTRDDMVAAAPAAASAWRHDLEWRGWQLPFAVPLPRGGGAKGGP